MQNAATMINACLGDVDVALTALTLSIAATLLVLLAGIAVCLWNTAVSDHEIRKKVAQRDLDRRARSGCYPGAPPNPHRANGTTGMRDESRPAPPPNPHRSSQVPPKPMPGDE